ncbi:MAG: tetratricopeptide repeat protein [Bacteroidales bacterium]|nr:tetratricopeptide repeat protein [Bacteroidales bacterium]
MSQSRKIAAYLCTTIVALACACSNTKNTTATRSFHNVTSRYNVVFEARQSYEAGIKAVNDNLKIDYTDLPPVYRFDSPDAAQIASSYMDACVEECGKNILKHSITSKPSHRYARTGMSAADQDFFNKPEFCKWIDDTYLLMGKANYVAADLDRAESSLQLGVTRFRHEPTKFEAQLWLAKTYWAQKNYDEAQELLDKLVKDLRHPKKLDADINKVYAQIAISRKKYPVAIDHLNRALELTKKKSEKAWLTYLLGDLNRMAGKYPEARKCYEGVIKMRPEYSMVFNAKINLAVVFTPGDNIEKIRHGLEALAKDPKNQPYRDQIYYALAEMEYRNENINSALVDYRLSAQYSSNNNIQKAKSYMAAAGIYFDKNDYINAGTFYDSTMSYLPKTYSDYDAVSKKAKNLSELITYIRTAEHQDSLQRVAKMSEADRNKLVQQIILNVINKEEEEKLMQSQPYFQSRDNNYGVEYTGQDGNPGFSGKWYLYNVTALNYGRTEFLKKWGNRPLEDNWRRKNKSESNPDADTESDETTEGDGTLTNKMPEYYLRNLPLTDSAMNVSVCKEADAWFAASGVYEEKIDDIDKAIETLLHLNQKHPDHYLMPQCLYQLVHLYAKKGEQSLSDYNKQQLLSQYPESGYAKILSDPQYLQTVARRKEDALRQYDNIVATFNSGNYQQAKDLCIQGQRDYSDLSIMENLIYMEARSYGRMRNTDMMRQRLEYLVEHYPNSKLAQPAQNKLDALASGRFETSQFAAAPDSRHILLAVIADTTGKKAGQVKFHFMKHCADQGRSQMDVDDFKLPSGGGNCQIITAKYLDNKDDAKIFCEEFLKQHADFISEEGDAIKIMIISDDNLSRIDGEAAMEAYYNYYIDNY